MIKMCYQSGVWLTHVLTSNLKIKKKENNWIQYLGQNPCKD